MADMTVKWDNAPSAPPAQVRTLGRLPSPMRESGFKSFFSNLRDFLVERPIKFRGKPPAFAPEEFGAGFGDNFKEFFQAAPRGAVKSDLLINWGAQTSLWQNLKDLISPPKLPPLEVTSKPIAVPEIWSKNTQSTRVRALSVAVHVLILVLMIVPFLPGLFSPATTTAANAYVPIDITAPKLPPGLHRAGGGGGGGAHEALPASAGRLPKVSLKLQIAPPSVKPPLNSRLMVDPTVVAAPNIKIPEPNLQNMGDPLAKVLDDSNGTGSGSGIGSGNGGGVGSGSGSGVGPGQGYGYGGGMPGAGENGYGTPVCIYCPSPTFTDEAVKAKVQGVVELTAVITADGRATQIRVAKGLSFGLDERAVEAVRSWRFRPAIGPDGRPSAVFSPIEVTFRIM
ncbi:MAG: energy transducer TonB [Candidatus Acidiferrales bacterium]